MKLGYFDLISPCPLPLTGVGHIIPPTLRSISGITNRVYETYLQFLNISPERYCTEIHPALSDWYESLDPEQKTRLGMYDIIVSSTELTGLYCSIFRFFLAEDVSFHREQDSFLTVPKGPGDCPADVTPGHIHKGNFSQVCSAILQLNHIEPPEDADLSKIKSKKGLAVYSKIQKLKKEQPKSGHKDERIELGNIISAVCAMHNSINYTNVWDLTVYQLWDTFSRLQVNNAYEINRTSVSVWGDKEHKFDGSAWFRNIRTTQ